MKMLIVIKTDPDDAQDVADMKAIELARHRAWNRLELPNPIGHLISPGHLITVDQVNGAGITFTEAKRVYERYARRAESSHFVPIDEAKAIVQAIDDALAVLERWKGTFQI